MKAGTKQATSKRGHADKENKAKNKRSDTREKVGRLSVPSLQ